MSVPQLPVSYTSVEHVHLTRPEIGSITALSSAAIALEAGKIEAMINGRLSKLYVTPVTPSPPLLAALATDLTVFKILADRSLFKTDKLKESPWFEMQKQALALLGSIADGSITLTTSAGTVIAARSDQVVAESNTMDYDPTFYDGGPIEAFQVDAQKLSDAADARG